MAKTVRMTTAQAIVKFLDNQYVSMDGVETKFVEGFFTIFASLIRFFSSWSRAAALPSAQTMHLNQFANTGTESQDRRWL